MPTIYPNLVPTVQAGSLFTKLINDNSVSIRWITTNDPVMFEIANRPVADIAVRQLMIAKAVDQINLRLGHQAYFPFVSQAKIISGTSLVELPLSWVWDMNVTLPEKWENLRLSKIKRISGSNMSGTGTESVYDGVLRLFFTASVGGSPTEYYIFYVDYDIASTLSYQAVDVVVVTDEEPNPISTAEANTVAGQVIFRTLDVNDEETRTFLEYVPPPTDTTDSNSDGEYDNPSEYEISDDEAGIINNSPISHGSGLLTDSAWNRLPDLGANVDSWIEAFNYPFRVTASRDSYTIVDAEPINIPSGLFTEFNMTVPAGDNETADYDSFPVWITRIKMGTLTNTDPNYITVFFATYNASAGNTSLSPVEFAYMTLEQNQSPGDIVQITPMDNLFGVTGAAADSFGQQFGRGHVVLSSKWGGSEVNDFFDKFPLIVGTKQALFVQENTIISPFGLSRVPKYSPTKGQSEAMAGTTAAKDDPSYPGGTNRYVNEKDIGIGNKVDMHAKTNPITGDPINPNPDIEQYGYEGSLLAKSVTLIVNAAGTDHQYETDVLPRLRCLFGRDFVHGDVWFDGTRWKRYDSFSNAWIG